MNVRDVYKKLSELSKSYGYELKVNHTTVDFSDVEDWSEIMELNLMKKEDDLVLDNDKERVL